MIQMLSVTNFKNETLDMELAHPEDSGLIVYNIEGIGGAKANINTTDITNGDGAWYNSSRVPYRNIVLTVKLLPIPNIEWVRNNVVYRYFPVKKDLRLTFYTDQRVLYIDGHVESNETFVFSNQEYSQISIICTDPYFYDSHGITNTSGNVVPLFEFPFCDDSVVYQDEWIPPEVYPFNENMIENFNMRDPINTHKQGQYYKPGPTIEGWYLGVETLGHGMFHIGVGFCKLQQFSVDEYPLKFYTYIGELENGKEYTASYLDAAGLHTLTFTVDRPNSDNSFEATFGGTDKDIKVQILADPGEANYRFQIKIAPGINKAFEFEAVKMEPGPISTLAHQNEDGEWELTYKQVIPEPPPEENNPTLEFGEILDDNLVNIDYEGSAEVGLTIELICKGPVGDIVLYDVDEGGSFTLSSSMLSSISGGAIRAGDIIYIYTQRGNKHVTLLRNKVEHNVTGAIGTSSTWFTLKQGTNLFRITAKSNVENLTANFSYNVAYSGV